MEKQPVHLFVFDTIADWEPGYAVAGINNPAFSTEPARYEIKTVGLTKDPVRTMGGLTLLPDLTLAEISPAHSALLLLPGGETWDQGGNGEAAEKAVEFLRAGVPVAAICGATEGLARVGVLDDRPHTSNALVSLQATGYRGVAHYRNEPAVTDGNLITAGSTAPLEFAYHIFKKLALYPEAVLEAWFGLFKTGEAKYFFALQELVGEE